MHERLEAVVSGRVQGVWFRDFTCTTARGLQVCGEVKNLPDGTVRVIGEGTREALEELLRHLHIGPPTAKVEEVQAIWKKPEGSHTTFELVRTPKK